ncbi:MAG TPA: carbohydrate-binding family 9-like protein [Ignavibacteriales bacterium]|nr:carbohydrate-binding family 9-like protein [Ignavibacteriales bacterium]
MRMMKTLLKYICLCAIVSAFSYKPLFSQKIAEPKIPFSPRHYVCFRTDVKMNIDGNLYEQSWQKAPWTEAFVDVEGGEKPAPKFRTRAKMLWDDNFLYVAAELEEPDLWATLTKRDTTIYNDNNFEIFIDPDGDTQNYYEFEINALNTFWDLLMTKPYRTGGFPISTWDIRGIKTAVGIQGTLNNPADKDQSWTVEIAFPLKVLLQSSGHKGLPQNGEQWRVDFTRVEWGVTSSGGIYKRNDDETSYWAWSPIGLVDFHYPEMYGYVQFSDNIAGTREDTFIQKPEEYAKWVLREIFYKEKAFFLEHGSYTKSLEDLKFDQTDIPGYKWPPVIETTSDCFEISAVSSDGKNKVYIFSDGKTGGISLK